MNKIIKQTSCLHKQVNYTNKRAECNATNNGIVSAIHIIAIKILFLFLKYIHCK